MSVHFIVSLVDGHSIHSSVLMRSDLQVCAQGTAAGNLAIVLKQLSRLGIKNWNELATAMKTLGFVYQLSVVTFWFTITNFNVPYQVLYHNKYIGDESI